MITENKRYIRFIDNYEDVYIKIPTGQKIEIGWEDDISVDSIDEVVDLLNEQDERIKELEKENASMKGRIINAMVKSNQVECNCTTCVCEDYVHEELKKW